MLVFISITPFISGALDPSSLVSNFGITFPGIGPILMISIAVLLIFLGRWENKYIKQHGIRTPKIRVNWSKLKKWAISSKKA